MNLAISLSVPTTYSVSAWFKTTSTTGGLIAGFGASAAGPSLTTDRVLYLTNSGALVFGNNNLLKAGRWHHVLATVGTAGMRLSVDGAQVASSSTTATAAYAGYDV